jgi:transcriptional regulator with XRE-family HTH domain
MILVNELKGLIARKGISQRKVAQKMGITDKTFYSKMKLGKFNSDEMQALIDILDIKNPSEIFFA